MIRQIRIWWLRSKGVSDQILSAENRSDGQGEKGARGRRRATAGDKSRGGAAWDSPEFTKTGARGVVSTRPWVGCVQRVTRDAPGPKAGTAGLCSPGMTVAAALRGKARRSANVPATGTLTGPRV